MFKTVFQQIVSSRYIPTERGPYKLPSISTSTFKAPFLNRCLFRFVDHYVLSLALLHSSSLLMLDVSVSVYYCRIVLLVSQFYTLFVF